MTNTIKGRLIPEDVQAKLAKKFKDLHTRQNEFKQTLQIINVCDIESIEAILNENLKGFELTKQKVPQAFATASYGIAISENTTDDDLTWRINGQRSISLGEGIYEKTKNNKDGAIPFSVDIQEGYEDKLEKVILDVIMKAGAVGVNIEDAHRPISQSKSKLMPLETAVKRIESVIRLAKILGLDDFVVNARTDSLHLGENLDEAIKRGNAYLDAGATSVFVWRGDENGLSIEEVKTLTEAFEGRVSFMLKPNGLTRMKLNEIGVARVSLGPQLFFKRKEGGDDLLIKTYHSILTHGTL